LIGPVSGTKKIAQLVARSLRSALSARVIGAGFGLEVAAKVRTFLVRNLFCILFAASA